VATGRSLGDDGKHAAALSLCFLGDIPYWQGDMSEARRLYEEAITFVRSIHNMNMLTYPLRRLGYVMLHDQNHAQAVELFAESLELNRQLGHLQGIVACLAGFAAVNLANADPAKAAILCACVENLSRQFGAPFFFADTVEYARCAAHVKQTLDATAVSGAWSEGCAMTLEQGIAYALTTTGLLE
jgi:hypothetical protein